MQIHCNLEMFKASFRRSETNIQRSYDGLGTLYLNLYGNRWLTYGKRTTKGEETIMK